MWAEVPAHSQEKKKWKKKEDKKDPEDTEKGKEEEDTEEGEEDAHKYEGKKADEDKGTEEEELTSANVSASDNSDVVAKGSIPTTQWHQGDASQIRSIKVTTDNHTHDVNQQDGTDGNQTNWVQA